jgi:hypothetical protein
LCFLCWLFSGLYAIMEAESHGRLIHENAKTCSVPG